MDKFHLDRRGLIVRTRSLLRGAARQRERLREDEQTTGSANPGFALPGAR